MERPWMPFYVNDYSGDTALLSLPQHGAFCLLLMHYWTLEELPADLPQLHRLCRCFTDEDKEAVTYVVGKYFSAVDGMLRNKRMDEEIKKAKEIAAKRSELGKKGNAIKHARNSERNSEDLATAKGIANASQTGSQTPSQNSRLSQSQSQSPSQPKLKKENPFVEQARRVLVFLNETAGRGFKETDANLSPIVARLRDGYTEEDCQRVVTLKTAEWKGGEMEQYLRPSTLFQAQKFDGYRQSGTSSAPPSGIRPPDLEDYSGVFDKMMEQLAADEASLAEEKKRGLYGG